MGITLEVYDGANWIDKTNKLLSFSHSLTSRELEKIEFMLLNDDVVVGQQVRAKRDNNIFFEGIVYEVGKRYGETKTIDVTAYSNLILYERHVIYRSYATGTTAGQIIRDLAGLESGVDVNNVDDGPSLITNWEIQNYQALRIMQDVAKGTNYWLRMRPGKYLYYKPKTTGTPVTTIDSSKVINAEYREDKWKFRNRIIYIGANGEVLADVYEGDGDYPEVIHDPFLTDATEAQRRAQVRLNRNKEYAKQLRVEMHSKDYEPLNLDLGNTVTVNLPDLGLSNINMYLVEVEYDPGQQIYTLTLGGKLELFEEYLSETIEGDVAARFGQKVSTAEAVGNALALSESLSKRFTTQLIPKLYLTAYIPPIPYSSGENITYNDNGEIVLASGFTSGKFTLEFMPQSENVEIQKIIFEADAREGSYSVNLKRGDGTIKNNISSPYTVPYIPIRKILAENDADKWSISGGSLSNSTISIISRYSLKAVGTSQMTLQYPSSGSLGWNVSECAYFNIYVYPVNDATITVKAMTDANNYYSASITVSAGKYQKIVKKLSDFTATGTPSWSNINMLQIILPAGTYYIDFDYVFTPISYEKLIIEVSLSRPSATNLSPIFKRLYVMWGEA